MQDIWRRGRQPLLVGGTMLYFHALSPRACGAAGGGSRACARRSMRRRRRRVGGGASGARAGGSGGGGAHSRQRSAAHPARARGVSSDRRSRSHACSRSRASAFAGVDVAEFAVAPLERAVLHRRIESRFLAMLAAGLLDEVRALRERGDLTAEHPSMRAVGYRQAWQLFGGTMRVGGGQEQAIAATRQLAKRQLTWLRRREKLQWFDSMHPDVAADDDRVHCRRRICRVVERFNAAGPLC